MRYSVLWVGKEGAIIGDADNLKRGAKEPERVHGASLVMAVLPSMAVRCMELNDTVFSRKERMRQPLSSSERSIDMHSFSETF